MALFSMTGFGCGSASVPGAQISVEMRSVNHRFLDVLCKLPPAYTRCEADIVKAIKETLKRGRVEVFVTRKETGAKTAGLVFNEQLYDRYMDTINTAFARSGIDAESAKAAAALNVLSRREVVEVQTGEDNFAEEEAAVQSAVKAALTDLMQMRIREGVALQQEILSHLTKLEEVTAGIQATSDRMVLNFKDRLKARIERLDPELQLDPMRIAQEVAILADRTDTTEELARLQSHFEQFRKFIIDEGNGKKLEFLLQEIGREINTTGSKTQSSEVTLSVVEAKAIIEKIREQIQNVE